MPHHNVVDVSWCSNKTRRRGGGEERGGEERRGKGYSRDSTLRQEGRHPGHSQHPGPAPQILQRPSICHLDKRGEKTVGKTEEEKRGGGGGWYTFLPMRNSTL